jgi:hypothetical protein
MAGLVPAIHVFDVALACKTWMPATSAPVGTTAASEGSVTVVREIRAGQKVPS